MKALIQYPSPNFNERPKDTQISLIILHYTEMSPVQKALDRLTDPNSKVSAHYLIAQNGEIYQLVEDRYRAWHAGISAWQGRDNMNDHSIGIELDHSGHVSSVPYSKELMISLIELLKFLCDKHQIDQKQIWAHSDIAPDRKIDPGEFFDWSYLAQHHFGMWFKKTQLNNLIVDEKQGIKWLEQIGYQIDYPLDTILKAFQRHFYPENVTGILDVETYRRLHLLIQQNFR